jgi:uncharacterized protein (AIM24 family)
MEGYIVLGGLAFLAGLLVGRHIGRAEIKARLMHYMMTTSAVHSVMRRVHEAHGIAGEVAAALKEEGFEITKVDHRGNS